jgi:hypothetical protein
MGRKLRTLLRWESHGAAAHLVFVINAGVALGVGIAASQGLKIPFNWGLVIAAAAFAGLTVCLLSPRAAWVTMIAGSGLVGLVAGYVGSWFFVGQATTVIGGVVVGAAVGLPTFVVYRHLVRATIGAGEMEGRYAGTFNERDENLRKGTGDATIVVSAHAGGDHDLRLNGLVVGGVPVELFGKRREEEQRAPFAELSAGQTGAAPFVLLRGRAQVDGSLLIVDLEGSPFGSYVFKGRRQRD